MQVTNGCTPLLHSELRIKMKKLGYSRGLAMLITTILFFQSAKAEDHGTIEVNVGETRTVYNSADDSFAILSWEWTKSNDNIQWYGKQFDYCTIKGVKANTFTTLSYKANCMDRYYYASFTLKDTWTVHVIQPVEQIKITPTTKTLNVGETLQITKEILPSDATYQGVTWSSEDPSIATVNNDGLVTAKGKGTTYIKCQHSRQTTIYTYCKVTVSGTTNEYGEFTAKTPEGIDMTFLVIDEDEKTCAVGAEFLHHNGVCVDKSTTGKITIPSSVLGYKVVEIGRSAFSGCQSITSIEMPTTIHTIGPSAFWDCTSLSDVTGYDNVEYISDDSSFYDVPWIDNQPEGLLYIGKVLYCCIGDLPPNTTVKVKEGTVSIMDYALYRKGEGYWGSNDGIVAIEIPASVKHIGKEDNILFDINQDFFISSDHVNSSSPIFCPNLQSIAVDKNNPYYDSRDNCNAIIEKGTDALIAASNTTVIPSNVKCIYKNAFYGLAEIKTIIIPDMVEKVYHGAISYCKSLESISIGKNAKISNNRSGIQNNGALKSIIISPENQYYETLSGVNAIIDKQTHMLLEGCSSTVIPLYVKSIRSFSNGDLKFLNIPDNVEELYNGAVSLNQLRVLTLGRGLKKTASSSVLGNELRYIFTTNENPDAIDKSTFSGADNKTLYVPKGAKAKYASTEGWTNFKEIVEYAPSTLNPTSYTFINEIKLNTNKIEIKVGETYQLSATIEPENASIMKLEWESTDENIATIDDNGLVSALSTGITYLHCRSTDGSNEHVTCFINVTEPSIKGDVNDDEVVNGTDLVALTNIILGKNTRADAADVNGDGQVNGTDYVSLVNIILGRSQARTRTGSTTSLSIDSSFAIKAGETKEMRIHLTNPVDGITLVQFDLRLPKGLTLKQTGGDYDIDMAGRTSWHRHSLDANQLSDGSIRFLLASSSNTLIEGSDGAIIQMSLVAADDFKGGDIRLEGILLVTPEEKEVKPDDYTYRIGGIETGGEITITPRISVESFDIHIGETQTVTIDLMNPNEEITLIQFDMQLPKGLTLKQIGGEYDIDMADRTTWRRHTLDANQLSDGSIRFLLASSSNTLIEGNSGGVITMRLEADTQFAGGEIRLKDILLVSPDETEYKPADVNYAIGSADIGIINSDGSSLPVHIFNLSGQKLHLPQKGINIINGRKVVVK